MNEHEHIYDDCVGNPPFAEALKTLGVDDTEWKLTEAQQRFFDEKKARVNSLPEDATEREKEFAKIALFMATYAENLQMALNRVKAKQRTAATATESTKAERSKLRTDFYKAWGVLIACYRAIDRNFGDEIRAHLEKNDRTQKEGKIRKLTAELERLANEK